jgi:hypothetical protein
MGTRPIPNPLLIRIEQLETPPKVRKPRLEFPLPVQRQAEPHVRPNETGRIVKPLGNTQRLLGKMLGLLHLEQVRMMELQAAERCEPPGAIPELPTEFPYPRIGLANVGVVVGFGRELSGTKRNFQVQLTLGPLAHIR